MFAAGDETVANWPDNPARFAPRSAQDKQQDISGYWIWNFVEENGELHPGVLALQQLESGRVVGYSVAEVELSKNSAKLRSAVVVKPLEGKVARNADGRLEFKFTVEDKENGGTASSAAVLAENGEALYGFTVQKFKSGKGKSARSASVDYKWVAGRAAS